MIMPDNAIVPSIATKPKGTRNTSRNSVTPIMPSGAVSSTIRLRRKLLSWIISKVITTSRNSGTPAATDFEPRLESSTVPPVSSR